MELRLENVYEAFGAGTIFPDDTNKPMLHMHISCGRKKQTITGCVRGGVRIWHVGEIVLQEIIRSNSHRKLDATTGFKLLIP